MNKGCEINCVICAVELEIKQERQDWKDKKPFLKFKSAELENMHLKMPWGTVFRASEYLAVASIYLAWN